MLKSSKHQILNSQIFSYFFFLLEFLNDMAFSPYDDDLLVTCSNDGNVRFIKLLCSQDTIQTQNLIQACQMFKITTFMSRMLLTNQKTKKELRIIKA